MAKRRYSQERLTNIAAILSMIQGTLFLAFTIYFLNLFMNDLKKPPGRKQVVLHHLTDGVRTLFLSILFISGLVHLSWIASSVYTLLGNRNGNARSVSQYVAVTSLVCLMDVIFPFIALPTVFTVFKKLLDDPSIHNDRLEESIRITDDDFGTYFWLLLTFIRGGAFTFAIDIYSATIAYQRFMDLHDFRMKVRGNPGLPDRGNHMFELHDDLDRSSVGEPTFRISKQKENRDDDINTELQQVTYVPKAKGQPQHPEEEQEATEEQAESTQQ